MLSTVLVVKWELWPAWVALHNWIRRLGLCLFSHSSYLLNENNPLIKRLSQDVRDSWVWDPDSIIRFSKLLIITSPIEIKSFIYCIFECKLCFKKSSTCTFRIIIFSTFSSHYNISRVSLSLLGLYKAYSSRNRG